jgi:hypothetical protein
MWASLSDVLASACSQPREGIFSVTDDLLSTAIDAASGQKLGDALRAFTVDLSIGGRI